MDIEVSTTVVHRHTVIAVTGDATELGILIEVVAAARVGNQSEEVLVTQIVDPGERGGGFGDDKLASLVVVVTVNLVAHSQSVDFYRSKIIDKSQLLQELGFYSMSFG